MSADIRILLFTAALIGFFHALTVPDYYLPFVLMEKPENATSPKPYCWHGFNFLRKYLFKRVRCCVFGNVIDCLGE